jgi:lactate dehydrogenase-like 2-hydroxyacid dehydrogenase
MSLPARVVFTRSVPGTPNIPGAQIVLGPDHKLPREEVLTLIKGATVIITMFTDRVDDEFITAAGEGLRGIVNYAAGMDNIDAAACSKHNITIRNTPHAVTEGTADLAWALLLACSRRLIEADRYARSPAYPANGHLGMSDFLGVHLTGKTLLIVGAGRIGHAVALRGLGWGLRTLYVARSRHWEFELAPLAARQVTLEDGLAAADIVSIHCPLTPETRGMFNPATFALMRPGTILINTARGPIIQEAALLEALNNGTLHSAGLDVFEHEPNIHPDLITHPKVTLSPHIGSAEHKYREEMTAMVCAHAASILAVARPSWP